MGIQEVQGNCNAQAYQKNRNAGRGEGFQKRFLQNLKDRDEAKQAAADAQVTVGKIGMKPGIRVSAAATQEAMQAVEVRHMSYEESDHVKIAVTEGYTLKGKREESADAKVYVEAKYDDGRLEAYQVEINKISANTNQKIEQFALETMNEV